jgi:hypothetical protein
MFIDVIGESVIDGEVITRSSVLSPFSLRKFAVIQDLMEAVVEWILSLTALMDFLD